MYLSERTFDKKWLHQFGSNLKSALDVDERNTLRHVLLSQLHQRQEAQLPLLRRVIYIYITYKKTVLRTSYSTLLLPE